MRHRFFERFRLLAGMLVLTVPLSCSGAADWPATIRAGVPASPAVAALLIGRSRGYDAERR